MDHFFVDPGPGGSGSPTGRDGRADRPDPAEDTDTADPAGRPARRLHPRIGADPAAPRRLRPDGGPGEGVPGNAMRYHPGQQRTPGGGTLLLEVSDSRGDGVSAPGESGLLLEKGRWLLSFAADAKGEEEVGAVFALNGTPLPFTAALLPGAEYSRRLALTAVLDLTAAGVLTVINNCRCAVTYRSAVLTAVRLV